MKNIIRLTVALIPGGWPVGVTAATIILLSGCGTGKPAAQNRDFFTSGSREADQRASQRMAKDEQLSGSGEGAGDKEKKKAARVNGDLTPTGNTAAQAPGKLTLFDRLGGEQGITAIVEDFTPRAMEDPRVDWERKSPKRTGFFHRDKSPQWTANAENVARVKKHLVQFLALATGGPAHYDGKEMKAAHSGMHITNAEFDAVLGDLKASMDKLQIPNKEQKELLSIVESTRPQIVTQR